MKIISAFYVDNTQHVNKESPTPLLYLPRRYFTPTLYKLVTIPLLRILPKRALAYLTFEPIPTRFNLVEVWRITRPWEDR